MQEKEKMCPTLRSGPRSRNLHGSAVSNIEIYSVGTWVMGEKHIRGLEGVHLNPVGLFLNPVRLETDRRSRELA
jgi:hypothetical protein